MLLPICKTIQSEAILHHFGGCSALTQEIRKVPTVAAVQMHTNSRKELINVTVGMAHRKKVDLDLLEKPLSTSIWA
jgi:hypothetical protein